MLHNNFPVRIYKFETLKEAYQFQLYWDAAYIFNWLDNYYVFMTK